MDGGEIPHEGEQGRGRWRSRCPGVRQGQGSLRDCEPEEGLFGMKMQRFTSADVEMAREYFTAVKESNVHNFSNKKR